MNRTGQLDRILDIYLFICQQIVPRPEDGPCTGAPVLGVFTHAHVHQQEGRQVLLTVQEEKALHRPEQSLVTSVLRCRQKVVNV